ncbi:restriction endonuclease subunit S [bacterium]|nr:restriction endonuclease subunit S [bacterium]
MIKELKTTEINKYKLSGICKFVSGERINRDECSINGKYPIISGGENIMGYANKFNFSGNNITISRYGKAGYVSFHECDIWVNDVAWVLEIINKDMVDVKFLYYYLKAYQKEIYGMILDGTIPPHISPIAIKNFEILLPNIDIQIKIANTLDKFAELEAELEARKKQYDYWLHALLNPNTGGMINDKNITYIRLQDICIFERGSYINNDDMLHGEIPVISGGEFPVGYTNKYNRDYPCITISSAGYAGKNILFHNEKF